MNPYLWGSFFWYFIHIISYKSDDLITLKKFYILLKKIIPCYECRINYVNFCSNNQMNFKCQDDVIDWTIRCHNYTNKKKFRPIYCRNDIEDLYQKINYNKLNIFIYIINKLYNKKKITKSELNMILSLYPNNTIKGYLLKNYKYRIPNKYLTFLLYFKIDDKIFISLLPDTCKKINHTNVIYNKKNMIINVNNIKIKLNNTKGEIKNLKLITTSKYDYIQRLNKIKNNNIIYHII